jgi:hypothetical protein
MPEIEISSGLETIITPCLHLRFRWMGGHWKQEMVSVGGCQAIPRIWSIEGQVAHDAPWRPASPSYQQLEVKKGGPGVVVGQMTGRSGPHHYSTTFTVEDRAEEVDIEFEVVDHCAGSDEALIATYLIESSAGHLHQDEAATVTWPHPETRLGFEAEPPCRVESLEAGMGTIRLMAIADPDPSAEVRSLRYRWRWITTPGHQIWDRDA